MLLSEALMQEPLTKCLLQVCHQLNLLLHSMAAGFVGLAEAPCGLFEETEEWNFNRPSRKWVGRSVTSRFMCRYLKITKFFFLKNDKTVLPSSSVSMCMYVWGQGKVVISHYEVDLEIGASACMSVCVRFLRLWFRINENGGPSDWSPSSYLLV